MYSAVWSGQKFNMRWRLLAGHYGFEESWQNKIHLVVLFWPSLCHVALLRKVHNWTKIPHDGKTWRLFFLSAVWTFLFAIGMFDEGIRKLWPLNLKGSCSLHENESCTFTFVTHPSVVRPRMADHIRRVLTGDVTDLPRKESNIVRIFTSSTFTGNYFCQP